MEKNLIKALSSLTGVRESKLKELDEIALYDVIDKPNIVDPTKTQLEKLNLLNELIVNFGITKEFKNRKQIDFSNSHELGKYFKHLIGSKKDKEVFLMAMFDKNDNLIKIKKISEGTIDSARIYPRDIIKEVLSTKPRSIVFCHNHPSGEATPSEEDIALTNNYINILEPLKVKVHDHIIVANNIYSFREEKLLSHGTKMQGKVAEKHITDYLAKDYYKIHLNRYLNALSSLTGIKKEKLYTFVEGEESKAVEILENPLLTESKLSLSSSERKSLKNLNGLFNNLENYVKEDMNPIKTPFEINNYVRTYLNQNDLDENGLYIMFFNLKSKIIGFEKLSYYERDNLTLNPKDILQKSIDYEANSIALIMTSKNTEINFKNKNISDLINISKNAVNILLPLQIKLKDSLYVNNDECTSLLSKGLLPYMSFGQAEYKKNTIFDYSINKDISQEEEIYEDDLEDEWELEF